MKYYKLCFLYGILLVSIAFCSCSKKISLQPKKHFVYGVSGFSDFTITEYEDSLLHLYLHVSPISGDRDSVTLLPIAIPKGVTFVTTYGAGIPDFSWIFAIQVHMDTVGTFPLTIQSSSPSGDTELHKFNIIVMPNPDCAAGIAGVYTSNTTCSLGVPLHKVY